MKILILANNDVGLYKFRKELIQELGQKNAVWISLPDGEFIPALKDLGCHYIPTDLDRRGMNPFKDFRLLLKYQKILREIDPDLVITYTIKPNIYGGIACRLSKHRYAENITGLGSAFQSDSKIKKLVEALYRFSCKNASCVFFENAENLSIFENCKISSSSQNTLLAGAGVNLDQYPLQPYPKDHTIHFLFIGRVMQEKGINELLEAASRLIEIGYDADLTVVGPMEEDFSSTFGQFQNVDWLHYCGFQSDVRPFIQKSSCFVLPSWHEGMANTNLECASSGRPIITSDIPGCREAVQNGITGYLVKKQNADSLFSAMKKFCELPYETRREMGYQGRELMRNSFRKELIVEKTMLHLFPEELL